MCRFRAVACDARRIGWVARRAACAVSLSGVAIAIADTSSGREAPEATDRAAPRTGIMIILAALTISFTFHEIIL